MDTKTRNELLQRKRLIAKIKQLGVEYWMHNHIGTLTDGNVDFKKLSRAEQLDSIKEFEIYINNDCKTNIIM